MLGVSLQGLLNDQELMVGIAEIVAVAVLGADAWDAEMHFATLTLLYKKGYLRTIFTFAIDFLFDQAWKWVAMVVARIILISATGGVSEYALFAAKAVKLVGDVGTALATYDRCTGDCE